MGGSESPPVLGADEPMPSPADPPAMGVPRRKRSSRPSRRRHGSVAGLLDRIGVVLACVVLVAAPLAAGGVHRIPMLLLFVTTALATGLLMAALASQGRSMRIGWVALAPLAFLLIPAVQSIPLPHGLRAFLDHAGSALLDENSPVAGRSWPLSLDPPLTRVQIGKAAAALAMFLIAFHLAAGNRRRFLLARVVGATGIAAVLIGFGHRIFGISKAYGMFPAYQTLLAGPFVNKNHNAEFLELTAFTCLACAFQRPSALNRVGWTTGALLCAVGVAGTLSRGGALAMVVGVLVFTFQRYLTRKADGTDKSRRRALAAWSLLGVGLVVVAASAVGAGQLIDRLHPSALSSDIRLKLWHDSLRVLAAHPLGIGRGAFERVYPIYRSLQLPLSLRFSFVENEPLQLLIESGWVLFAGVAAGMSYLAWTIIRRGRHDLVEAALVSGLVAVLTHALLDFGLQTLGVLLTFVTVLGLVLGRALPDESRLLPARRGWPLVVAALGALVFGIGSIAHASHDDFDKLLRNTNDPGQRRQILERAQRTHPLDYFYVLNYARTEPLRPRDPGGSSPRLHALNRALRLCPECDLVHVEVARNLWQMKLRSQALVEWRTAVKIQPGLFSGALTELFTLGARPEELAVVGTADPRRMIDVVNFLIGVGRVNDAIVVLGQADAMGAPQAESMLARARLQLQAGRLEDAKATLAQAHAARIQDPRLFVLDAELMVRADGPAGVDRALSILDTGAARYPDDVPIQRMRVDLISNHHKWQSAERALEGLKMALYAANGSAGEAHVAAARIQSRLLRWTAAIGEYRIALSDNPADMGLWLELGGVAEKAGRDATAREAYAEAARLSPSSPEVKARLRGIDERQAKARSIVDSLDRAGTAQP